MLLQWPFGTQPPNLIPANIYGYTVYMIRGKPKRALEYTRNQKRCIYVIIFIYFVHDLAWQQPNAHAQPPRVRM